MCRMHVYNSTMDQQQLPNEQQRAAWQRGHQDGYEVGQEKHRWQYSGALLAHYKEGYQDGVRQFCDELIDD